LAGAAFVLVAFFSATATGDFATAFATGAGHLMNLPLASLHWTAFVAAGLVVVAALGAADALAASANAAVPARMRRIISFLSCWRPFGRHLQRYGQHCARAIRRQKNLADFDQNLSSIRAGLRRFRRNIVGENLRPRSAVEQLKQRIARWICCNASSCVLFETNARATVIGFERKEDAQAFRVEFVR
jgi:hypothetical protein